MLDLHAQLNSTGLVLTDHPFHCMYAIVIHDRRLACHVTGPFDERAPHEAIAIVRAVSGKDNAKRTCQTAQATCVHCAAFG